MPLYLTGFIDEHTDRLKNDHDNILPLGMIVQPKTYRDGYLGRAGLYTWVAIDNGRFTEAGRRLFKTDKYDCLIGEGMERAGDHLLFATAPDVPFDWGEPLQLSRTWLRRIRRKGCLAALCAQEGMTIENIPWDDFDCLFIGGRDAFKEGPLVRDACREARRRGKWVHMGRVNGLRRLLVALDFGVDSVDGTFLLQEARKGRAGVAPQDVRLAATAPRRAAAEASTGPGGARGRCGAARRPHGRLVTPPTDPRAPFRAMRNDTGGRGVNQPRPGGDRRMKITASCTFNGHDLTDIPVINPGGWFGKAWLVEIGGSYTPLFLVVEADDVSNAIDELSGDPTFGPQIHVSDDDLGDYPEDERRYDGSGRVIDLDWVAIHGREGCDLPYSVKYHVGDEPVAFDPRRFAAWQFN